MNKPAKVNNREVTYLSNGYALEVIREKDILADIDFDSQDDFNICKDIISQLESKGAEILKEGKTVALPYIGRLRKPLIKQEYLKNRNLLKVARSVMTKEDYNEYKKETYKECASKIISQDNLKKLRKRVIALNRKKYIQKYNLFGEVIANIWIESILWLKPVEFNQEIQDVFDEIESNENNNRKINNR